MLVLVLALVKCVVLPRVLSFPRRVSASVACSQPYVNSLSTCSKGKAQHYKPNPPNTKPTVLICINVIFNPPELLGKSSGAWYLPLQARQYVAVSTNEPIRLTSKSRDTTADIYTQPKTPFPTANLSSIILNQSLHPSNTHDSAMVMDRGSRKRRSSSIVYHEPPESIEQLSDQGALPNLNAEWVNAKGGILTFSLATLSVARGVRATSESQLLWQGGITNDTDSYEYLL